MRNPVIDCEYRGNRRGDERAPASLLCPNGSVVAAQGYELCAVLCREVYALWREAGIAA